MSVTVYKNAQRLGLKEVKALQAAGKDPYVESLDDRISTSDIQSEVSLGVIDIPMEQIAGTRTVARRNAFSRSFYPILETGGEFADKWEALAEAHLNEGIRDPIKAVEYMNRFYVVEGNKRVSVLRFYGAVSIPGEVTRLLPVRNDTEENQVYYEFIAFYKITKICFLRFHKLGQYEKLLTLIGAKSEEPWDEERRRLFTADCIRFRNAFCQTQAKGLSMEEALLRYLTVYDYAHFHGRTEKEFSGDMRNILPELRQEAEKLPPALSMEPEEKAPSKNIIKKLIHTEPKQLKVAFLHDKSAVDSRWTFQHELGRVYAMNALGDKVKTMSIFNVFQKDKGAGEIIADLVADGYDMIFTTTPRLLRGTLAAAAKYPNVKLLNCSLQIRHPLLRTYYGRMFEAKFVTGVIAAAMSPQDRIGYISNYPIYGMPASINAFALGAQMVNPNAVVELAWTGVQGATPYQHFKDRGIQVVSGQDMYAPTASRRDYGLYLTEDDKPRIIARSLWNWGRFYERIIRSVLDGSWGQLNGTADSGNAINYWWGMDAGVIEVQYSDTLPRQTKRLIELIQAKVADRSFRVFEGPLHDNGGNLRMEEGQQLNAEEIIRMNWLAKNVIGRIPSIDELTPSARELVKIQGVLGEPEGEIV